MMPAQKESELLVSGRKRLAASAWVWTLLLFAGTAEAHAEGGHPSRLQPMVLGSTPAVPSAVVQGLSSSGLPSSGLLDAVPNTRALSDRAAHPNSELDTRPAKTAATRTFADPSGRTFAGRAAKTNAPAARPKLDKKAEQAIAAGDKAFKSGDLKGAQTQYKAAIKADSKAYPAHYALGVVQERKGDLGAAAKSYRAAINIVPDHEPSVVAYCLLLARQNNFDEALDFAQKKNNEWGPSAAFVAAKAEVKSMQGRSGDAQELAQQALKIDPNYKPAMVTLARDHYRADRKSTR